MARKRKSTPVRGILLFILLVAISGYALAAAGHFDNPFVEMSQTAALGALLSDAAVPQRTLGSGVSGSGETLPAVGGVSDAGPGGDSGNGDSEQETVAWSQVGDVLFDLWFLCAASAVFIVVQLATRFGVRQIKRLLLSMTATGWARGTRKQPIHDGLYSGQ